MKTKSFIEELKTAREHSYAVGAFNIFNDLSARAVISAAAEENCPLILQTSVTTVKKYGPAEMIGMLRRLAWEAPVNVIIHLDHCRDVNLAKACIDAGWDSVMFDGSSLAIEENISRCREVVNYAHPRGVQVEGEYGRIFGVEDDINVKDDSGVFTDIDGSIRFVEESGIDAYAPAIGTAHGVYKSTPRINFELVNTLSHELDKPIVIHGGTGLNEATFSRLILAGGAKINVSTAIKHAYFDGFAEYVRENPDSVDPLKLDRTLEESIRNVARKHIITFRKNMK